MFNIFFYLLRGLVERKSQLHLLYQFLFSFFIFVFREVNDGMFYETQQ